jgi:tRNA isopentenyl-2-thiomethyl-A-37 hydroxylase MiaE
MDIIDADDSIPCGRKAAEAALQIVADWEREADVAKQMDAYAAGDLPEIPVLEPITVRPVELNAVLWDEWKRIAEKMA